MTSACSGQPISWLALERYELGELGPADRAAVCAHLEGCPACRGCLARIRADAALPLPPLAAPAPRPARRWWPLGLAFTGAAAAAALLFAWLAPGPAPLGLPPGLPGPRVAVKGGELSLGLVRERGGAVSHGPATFLPGDRFRVELTCPPPDEPFVELVVYQDGEAVFPLPVPARVRCGNRAPLHGAFRLTGGGQARVCAVLSARPVARDALAAGLPPGLADQAVCASLRAGR